MAMRKLSPGAKQTIVKAITTQQASISELAQRYGVSYATISYAFWSVTGERPGDYFSDPSEPELHEADRLIEDENEVLDLVAKRTQLPMNAVIMVLVTYTLLKEKRAKQT